MRVQEERRSEELLKSAKEEATADKIQLLWQSLHSTIFNQIHQSHQMMPLETEGISIAIHMVFE